MSNFKYVLFDIEGDGFKPTTIFCVVIHDLITGEGVAFPPELVPEACMILEEAELVFGHNIRGYDCPVIEKLTDGLVKFDPEKIIDTLDMSRKLTNNQKHSLEFWGDVLGLPKLKSPLFERYTPEMLTYCERDVAVNVKVFFHLLELYLANPRDFRNSHRIMDFMAAVEAALLA